MPRLTDPLAVGPRTLKNRLIMPPMANNLADEQGHVTPRLVEHYAKRSDGPALVIVEHAYITPVGRVDPHQLGCWEDACVPGLSQIAEAIHDGGALAAMQITHGGARCPAAATGRQPISPSGVGVPGDKEEPRPMTLDEIAEIPGLFAAAAGRAAAAGFDGVEVHGAHGYLLNEFMSPYTNRRTDEYGGDDQSRLRLIRETLAAVTDALSADHLLLYRFGAEDDVEGGLTAETAAALAPSLEGWGVHLIDVSGGLCGSRPANRTEPGFFIVPAAAAVKARVSIPVSGVGGVTEADGGRRLHPRWVGGRGLRGTGAAARPGVGPAGAGRDRRLREAPAALCPGELGITANPSSPDGCPGPAGPGGATDRSPSGGATARR